MAKKATLVFDDESLLRGVREQAILENKSMSQYIQDLIRDDLRQKVGCKIVKRYTDGTTEETEMWSLYEAGNTFTDAVNQIRNPMFTEDGQTATKILDSIEVYEKGEKVAESPNSEWHGN